MRKRLTMVFLSLGVLTVLAPAAPAAATSCDISDPGLGDVQCVVYGTPVVGQYCVKLGLC